MQIGADTSGTARGKQRGDNIVVIRLSFDSFLGANSCCDTCISKRDQNMFQALSYVRENISNVHIIVTVLIKVILV